MDMAILALATWRMASHAIKLFKTSSSSTWAVKRNKYVRHDAFQVIQCAALPRTALQRTKHIQKHLRCVL